MIDIPDLEIHLKTLASDKMEGRSTGESGLDSAAAYLSRQARRIGLKAIDHNRDYYQHYTLINKRMDPENSSITIKQKNGTLKVIKDPIYLLNPDSTVVDLEGEAVFAGYGIHSGEDDYNDFEGIDLEEKIVLVMNRGPLDEAGNSLLSGRNWANRRSFQYKMPGIVMRMPRAVLIVMDPRSGHASLKESMPGMARYLSRARYVKELGEPDRSYTPAISTKILFIHRRVADKLLESGSTSLAALQDSIDVYRKPASFEMPGTNLQIRARYVLEEIPVPNVVGLVEGNDPKLRDEVIIFSAHFDHLGTSATGEIYNGADDNASGTAALIELGEAFMAEQKHLKRSVMLLWVSGEEIGLFGSEFYSEYPLIPLEKTVANLNLDMIGSIRTQRDKGRIHGERVTVLGMDSIGLIGGHQSSELMDIHTRVAENLGMGTDLSLNDPDHPYRYFYRSDHYNFARHNIPVLFYSTGVHVDYHKVTDDYERIHFPKLKKVTELSFLVGYELATMRERIKVDNPFSDWGRPLR
jgi:hypothetical protein